MSLFNKKSKEANEELRDDYIELGATSLLEDGSTLTNTCTIYDATFEEMLARVGKVTANKENGSAFIVQQFMTLKEHNEMIDSNRRKKRLDN